ncbi:hypothetical protein BT96DRAFT_982958 [Gymnopus androsaceus JB14]|uniref:Zinc-finger domain-containing protein n=1 Tax=Gymnopus androsaceus JB14 TaxID=1447944 RepID=A0A6A4ITI5_9AGAR|nr:hypothetical protein BT96DRAFT_982958 [Gymnopus androsaceus JB14]
MGSGKPSNDDALINCHHCRVKRDPSDIVQCTFHICRTANATKTRCTLKYCRNCLKKKYNEDLDAITTTTRGQRETGHAEDAYIFKCPKCRGQCSCWRCKKRIASQTAAALTKATKTKETQSQSVPGSVNIGRPPKPLVPPIWSIISTQLSFKDAEDRIFIREFVQRFSNLRGMTIPKAQLQELEFIGGTNDQNDSNDDEVYTNWVSETCVRSLVLSLIGVLAAEEESSATLAMKNTMKDIRNSGVNLTKIWAVLATLRAALGPPDKVSETDKVDEHGDDESSEDRIILDYPDPSPPPANHSGRSTRSVSTDAFPVVHAAQMIPVILGLIETVLESHAVRTELEEGTKDGREKFRESRECIKLENESWDQLRKSLEEAQEPDVLKIKAERQAHKLKITGLENAAKVIASAFIPRFTPLGSDSDGRIYWALTPGVYDREYALDYIASRQPQGPKSKKPRNRKHRVQKEESDRKALKEWTWFLAVWGTEPTAMGASATADKQWWGFWDPVEIHRLAEWISVTNDLKTTGDPSSGRPAASRTVEGLKTLVKNIAEYATLLEWRAQGEED